MRKVLGIIVCVSLTGCQALRYDQGCEGKGAPCDENGVCGMRGSYEGYLTTTCPQGMAPSGAPAQSLQVLIPGPNGPSVAYLQFPDGDPGGYGNGTPRTPLQQPFVQAAFNAPAPEDASVRAMQTEVNKQICQQVIDLKHQVQDLTSQVKTCSEPVRDRAVEAIATNLTALNRQIDKLNEGLTSLKATQERSASAAPPGAAAQEAPVPAALATASSPVRTASAQAVQPPPLLAANEPIDSTQSEVNRLVTQCLLELKAEIRELNTRLAKFSDAPKSGE